MIRPAGPADVDAVVVLLAELGYERTAAEVAVGLARPELRVLVAEQGGAAVGVLALARSWRLHLGVVGACIDALVVAEGHRDGGVGGELVEAAVALAWSEGAGLVDVHSNERRVDAHRFYERLGFVGTSRYFVRQR